MKKQMTLVLAGVISAMSLPCSSLAVSAQSLNFSYLSSSSYEREVEWELFEDFIRYDLKITDYDALSSEQQELSKSIFEKERSAKFTIRCERARKELAETLTNSSRPTAEGFENAETYLLPDDNCRFSVNLYLNDYVPDIVYLDYDMNGEEYWLDDNGNERITRISGMDAYTYVKFTDDGDKLANYKFADGKALIYKKLVRKEASADNIIDIDGNIYIINADETASLIRSSREAEEIVIPEKIEGHTVTRIEEEAFFGSMARTVSLPETIVYIGDSAFEQVDTLEEINIPDSLEYIGKSAFASCMSLKGIKISAPELTIGNAAFFNTGLAYADLNVKVIDERAFNDSRIKTLTLHEGLEDIGAGAFAGCRDIESVELPSTLKFIGQNAFTTSNIKNVIIPENVEIMGTYSERYGSIMTSLHGEIAASDPLTAFNSETIINSWYDTEAFYYAMENGMQFKSLNTDIDFGDVNKDGNVNIADGVSLQSILLGRNSVDGYEADVTKDGKINSSDMSLMRKNMFS